MAKYPSKSNDPYIDPISGVLTNLVGARTQEHLDHLEATFSAIRMLELRRDPIAGNFDLAHLQTIHRHLFSDVYAWAGELRTVDISKGETRFANHQQIEGYAPTIFRGLAAENLLRGLDPDEFSLRAGTYLGEINVLHPFREGNGRTQREFITQVAHQCGYAISWRGVDRVEMLRASIEAYQGNARPMGAIIKANLIDLDREHAISIGRESFPGLVNIASAESGRTYVGPVLGMTERYVVQANGDATVVLHNRCALAVTSSDIIRPGPTLQIRYPHGEVGVVAEVGAASLQGPAARYQIKGSQFSK